mgnify:CR=1 FL=1
MKVTVLKPLPGEEEEIIVKCLRPDEKLMQLLNRIKDEDARKIEGAGAEIASVEIAVAVTGASGLTSGFKGINFYKDSRIVFEKIENILYFESVDDKVFAYKTDDVLETKLKLYMLEELLSSQPFFRASKAVIVNLDKVESLAPAFGGRFEAKLQNGYKVIISRNYVAALKKLLNL